MQNSSLSLVFLIAFMGLFIISCNNKKKETPVIVGKWVYREMYSLPDNVRMEKADSNAKGTAFEFSNDGKYVLTSPLNETRTGNYYVKDSNRLLMMGDNKAGEQILYISYPANNRLRLEDRKANVAMVLERLQ